MTKVEVKPMSVPPAAPTAVAVGQFGAGAVALVGESIVIAYLGGARRSVPAPKGEVVAVGLVGTEPAVLLRDGLLLLHSKHGWRQSSALFEADAS